MLGQNVYKTFLVRPKHVVVPKVVPKCAKIRLNWQQSFSAFSLENADTTSLVALRQGSAPSSRPVEKYEVHFVRPFVGRENRWREEIAWLEETGERLHLERRHDVESFGKGMEAAKAAMSSVADSAVCSVGVGERISSATRSPDSW